MAKISPGSCAARFGPVFSSSLRNLARGARSPSDLGDRREQWEIEDSFSMI